MNNTCVRWFTVALLVLGVTSPAWAEVIQFKDGRITRAAVIERSEWSVRVKDKAGDITYFMDEITRINAERIQKNTWAPAQHWEGDTPYTGTPGVVLRFPDGWYVLSGREKKAQKLKDAQARLRKKGFEPDGPTGKLTLRAMLLTVPEAAAFRLDPALTAPAENAMIWFDVVSTETRVPLEYEREKIQNSVIKARAEFVEPMTTVTVDGVPGLRYAVKMAPHPGVEMNAIFIKGDKKYIVTLRCRAAEYEQLTPLFRAFVDSMTWVPAEEKEAGQK